MSKLLKFWKKKYFIYWKNIACTFCTIQAVASSQDGSSQQPALSELDEFFPTSFEDELINSGMVFKLVLGLPKSLEFWKKLEFEKKNLEFQIIFTC